MIRSFYGLTQNPFDRRELDLLPGQQEILDTLKVHCQQGGLCLVLSARYVGRMHAECFKVVATAR